MAALDVEHLIRSCETCAGNGMVDGERCETCNGQGFTRLPRPAAEDEAPADEAPADEPKKLDYNFWKKPDLVALAESKGLDTEGTKAEIVARIKAAEG